LWDWPGVGNSSTKGRTRGFIPDGKICSANNKTYAAYDAPRADWPATHLTSGSKWNYRFPSHDGHPGTFYLYMTKDSYDPTKTLTWNDIEEEPFDTEKLESPNASGPDGREFAWDITLPAKKSGRHILLAFWQRSDADGSFFSCSDVVFDGGKGEISGYPNSNEWKGTEPTTPPSTPAGTPTPTGTSTGASTSPVPTGTQTETQITTPAPTDPPNTTPTAPGDGGGTGRTCTAQVEVKAWSGGYLGTVTVLNHGASQSPWKVGFTVPAGLKLYAGWNADAALSGTTVTATAPAWNRIMTTGSEVSVGFVAAGPSSPPPSGVTLNGKACGTGSSGDDQPAPSSTTPVSSTDPSTQASSTTPASSTDPSTPSGSGSPASGSGDVALADGFESQTGTTPSATWAVKTKDCSGQGKATVDSAVARTGSKSLRIDGAAGFCNHVFVGPTKDLSTLGPTWFARMYVKHTTALPASHTTFLAMKDANDNGKDLRVGGQNSALQWNRESDDATLPAQSPAGVAQSTALPISTWQCLEIEVNGSKGTAHTWLNGNEVKGLTADGVPTNDVDNQWYAKSWKPAITDLRLGWESYGEGADTLWYDDVAIDTTRIGC
jgi:predicted carbohydrate-binding protein with CBM5 and CBM33 domain